MPAALAGVVVLQRLFALHMPASPYTPVAPHRLAFPGRLVALGRPLALVW